MQALKSLRPARDDVHASLAERYTTYYVLDDAKHIQEQLEKILKDYDELRYRGLSGEEIELLRKLEKRTVDNIKNFLRANE